MLSKQFACVLWTTLGQQRPFPETESNRFHRKHHLLMGGSNKAGSRAHSSLVWASRISWSCFDSSDETSMDQGSYLEHPSPATISTTYTVQLQFSPYKIAPFQQALWTTDPAVINLTERRTDWILWSISEGYMSTFSASGLDSRTSQWKTSGALLFRLQQCLKACKRLSSQHSAFRGCSSNLCCGHLHTYT